MKLHTPPVKVRAQELNIPVFQPTKVRDGTLSDWMKEQRADAALVMAYGRILTPETLSAPRLGCVNLHASLLPKYRGAAPIQRALMEGEDETGICLMHMDRGMDTGPVLSCRTIPILADDDTGSLSGKIAELARHMTLEDIPRFLQGELISTPQDSTQATHALPLTGEDRKLDFSRPGIELERQIRALSPRPGASVHVLRRGTAKSLKLLRARLGSTDDHLSPGEVGRGSSGQLLVGTGDGTLEILLVQPQGKKMQTGADALNGRSLLPGEYFNV
jgi:methionyl-tRNA formyltransferase